MENSIDFEYNNNFKISTVIRNYLKIAWRNLWKNKTMTFINVLGLMTGITCCLLIGLYIQHEYSYDRFQQRATA
ncbi:ABC transporter permease [Paraflavitalea speifideaquila]|uniref:ABC transporter permease n=1 Tax=Paraflavitalea speifideaquila TaxID=3076558 RepID=UPI0028EBDCED|nr:ABC transporter permease [Paraflavitalea speifideiaquila]